MKFELHLSFCSPGDNVDDGDDEDDDDNVEDDEDSDEDVINRDDHVVSGERQGWDIINEQS